jgi:cytochrome c oxidase cbb3-type subunit 2
MDKSATGLALFAEPLHVPVVRRLLAIGSLVAIGAAVWTVAVADPEEDAPAVTEPAAIAGADAGAVTPVVEPKPAEPTARGAWLYDRFCLACHGTKGDGRGPGAPWLWPRPRDFTRGEYKWRTTESGSVPTDQDLATAIRRGAPGTSMHAFTTLDDKAIDQLVVVVKSFAPKPFSKPPQPLTIGAMPGTADKLAKRGKQVYRELGCGQCHGNAAKGDGPSAPGLKDSRDLPSPPYDLTTKRLRRPRNPGESSVTAIYTSMVSGLNGTPMPSYVGTAPDEDLWAVAAFIDSIRAADPAREPLNNSTDLDPLAAKMAPGIKFGYWPYSGDDIAEADIWGKTIPFQGEPPAGLTPAQTSLEADRCTRCHAKQRREWRDSFHAQASSPGLIAQLIPMEQNHNGAPLESCQRCHQPLAEQQPLIRPGHSGGDDKSRDYSVNPLYKSDLRDEAINCAACHVRKWKRHGPKPTPDSKLLELPNYPFEEMAIYERADFCLACHQTPPKAAVDGKPLLNTYREWLEGPYMRLGVQCQHCHMPNREHTWRGVHDPETFRQGFDIEAIAARSEKTGAVSVRTRMTNVGAGHYLPRQRQPRGSRFNSSTGAAARFAALSAKSESAATSPTRKRSGARSKTPESHRANTSS